MTQMSNFKRCALINQIAGNTTNPKWGTIEKQFRMMVQEMQELQTAIIERNLTQVRDATGDVKVLAYGMGARGGWDCDQDMAAICDGIMTRFDQSFDDASLTMAKYLKMQVEVDLREVVIDGVTYLVSISAYDQQGYLPNGDKGEFYPKGKFLKSHRFQEAVFTPLEESIIQSYIDDAGSPVPQWLLNLDLSIEDK